MSRNSEFASSVNDRGRGRDGDRGRRRDDYEPSFTGTTRDGDRGRRRDDYEPSSTGTARQLEYPRQSGHSEYSTQASPSSAASTRRTSSRKPPPSTTRSRRTASQRPPVSRYGGSIAGGFVDPSEPPSEVGTVANIDGSMHKSVTVVGEEIERMDKLKGRKDDTKARELAVDEARKRWAEQQKVLSPAQREKRIDDFSQSTLDRSGFDGHQSSRAPTSVRESSSAHRNTEEGRSGRPRGQSTASKTRRPYEESEPVVMTASIQHRSRRLTMEHSSKGGTTVSFEQRHHSTQIYTSSHGRKDERGSSSSQSLHPRAIKNSVSGASQSRNQPTSIAGHSTSTPTPSISQGSISGASSARSRTLEFRPKDPRYDDSKSSASASTVRPGTVIRDRLPSNFPEFPNSESGAKTIHSSSNASSLRKPAASIAGTDLRSQYSARPEGSRTGSVLNPTSVAGSARHSRPPTAYRDYPSSVSRSASQAGSRKPRDPYDDRYSERDR